VKSWSKTRAGVKEISRVGGWAGDHRASASMSSRVTVIPSSVRSSPSSRILREYGRRPTSAPPAVNESSRKISNDPRPTFKVDRAPKLLVMVVK
jgi:hypothetical protein